MQEKKKTGTERVTVTVGWTDFENDWFLFTHAIFVQYIRALLFAFWVELITESKVDDNVFPIWGKSFITVLIVFCLLAYLWCLVALWQMLIWDTL